MGWGRSEVSGSTVIKTSPEKCRKISQLKASMKLTDEDRERENTIKDALRGYGSIGLMMPSLKPARKEDYVRWLQAAINNGVMPTEFSERTFDKSDGRFFVTTGDIVVFPTLAAQMLRIIVREGHEVEYASEKYSGLYKGLNQIWNRKGKPDLGHSCIYLPSGQMFCSIVDIGFRNRDVPMYSDIYLVCE